LAAAPALAQQLSLDDALKAGEAQSPRLAAPMIGGMITAPLLSMFVLPAAYLNRRLVKLSTAKGE
jgi:Cu/Ag efflux pump CusA